MAGELSEDAVKDAQPRQKKYWLSDRLNGLHLLVMPSGAKYWKFRFRYAGKNDELTVASPYPKGTLTEARKKAKKLQVIVEDGGNPRLDQRRSKVEAKNHIANTFQMASEAWYFFRLKAWKARTAEQVRDYLTKDLQPALGRYPLGEITTQMLADLVHKIDARGAPDVAKKARQWLRSIYEYSRAKGWTAADPVKDLKAITILSGQPERYAHLPPEEFPAFLQKLSKISASPFVKGAAYLAIWTANRPGVTRTILWSEVDLDNGFWTISKGRDGMKRGYKHITPLPVQAIAYLRDMHRLSGTFDHVFIGRNDPSKSISNTAVNRMIKRMGYGGKQTMHGFRHVVSSALNDIGYQADHIERQLAHGDPDKMRDRYNEAPYLRERKRMLQDWANIVDKMAQDAFLPSFRIQPSKETLGDQIGQAAIELQN